MGWNTRALPWQLALLAVSGVFIGFWSCGGSGKTPAADHATPAITYNCEAPPRPAAAIDLLPVFDGLKVETPVALVQAPRLRGEARGRWFIADQHGLVHSFRLNAEGAAIDKVTSDVTDRVVTRVGGLDERGLLGLALTPEYAETQQIILSYSGSGSRSVIASFDVADGVIQTASERILLQTPQPYTNHNGGHVVFGPDGYLYIGLGDGGAGGDPLGNGQNAEALLGSILRVAVSGDGASYTIPDDNPFAQGGGRPEIFAYGLRNPWRFTFDRETGQMWAGDVGQDAWEEVTLIESGGNHGWNAWEGFECYPPGQDCDDTGLVMPVHAYRNPEEGNRSVTGGFVYRGSALPDLVGDYVFADYVTGEIWRLEKKNHRYDSGVKHNSALLLSSNANISSFAEDQDGELYVLDHAVGRVLKLVPSSGGVALPSLLGDTGCFDDDAPTQLRPKAIPYDVVQSFWSDGARKERYLVLPEGQQISRAENGEWQLPLGGMAIKNFFHERRLLETRFYVRHSDGEYSGYGYAWNEAQTRAELVVDARTEEIDGLTWTFPGRADCGQCHTAAAGRTLGVEANQLTEESAKRLSQLGKLSEAMLGQTKLPSLDSPAPLGDRARAYLHVNCSSCHQPGGPGRGGLDLRFRSSLEDSGLCGVASLGNLETAQGKIVAATLPEESVLYQRMTLRSDEAMPPLASHLVDEVGSGLIRDWITSLDACP